MASSDSVEEEIRVNYIDLQSQGLLIISVHENF